MNFVIVLIGIASASIGISVGIKMIAWIYHRPWSWRQKDLFPRELLYCLIWTVVVAFLAYIELWATERLPSASIGLFIGCVFFQIFCESAIWRHIATRLDQLKMKYGH